MDTQIRTIVLIPRYSTYVGARTYFTVPLNVREFAYAHVNCWRGDGLGSSSPTIALQLQASTDLQIWDDIGSAFGSSAGESQQVVTFTKDWLRFAVTLTGVDPAFPCWSVGEFATRTPSDAGGGR